MKTIEQKDIAESKTRLFQTLKLIVLICLASLFVGCVSYPEGDSNVDQAAKTFSVKSGKANIYLFRKSNFVGGGVTIPVSLDGQTAGAIASGTYFYWEVNPGPHTVTSTTASSMADIKLNTVAGQNYFIEQKVTWRLAAAGGTLREASETDGKQEVVKCTLIQNGF